MWIWMHKMWWVGQYGQHHREEKGTWGQVGWLSAGRTGTHIWAGRETCSWVGQWFLGNGTNRPSALLGTASLILDTIRWLKSRTYTATLGYLWLQVQAGLSLREIPLVPAGVWCGEGGSQMKTACDEDKLHWKMQINALKWHRVWL